MAAGDLARHQLALDLETDLEIGLDTDLETDGGRAVSEALVLSPVEGSDQSRPRRRASRQVVLYVHLSERAITGSGGCPELASVENTRQGITAEQVRGWCASPETTVSVKPVIDLDAHLAGTRLRGPRPAARTGPGPRPHLRLPLVRPPRPALRPRPRHRLRLRLRLRLRRERTHLLGQPRPPVPTTSPPQDPLPVDLHRHRPRHLPVVQPPRLPVPARPHRHPRRLPRPTPTPPRTIRLTPADPG